MSTTSGAAGDRTGTPERRPGTTESPYPRRWAALAVLACGLGLVVLDGTIVGVSMPTIIRELGLDLAGAQWVTSLYAVVFAAFLLTAGRIGDFAGRRRLFLVGVALFTVGSVMAALATGGGSLIGARVIQGLGGAAILPSTLSTVNVVFRGRERAAAFGVWGAVMAGAAAIGPLAGGLLTENIGWESIFWVNVPIGVALIVAGLAVVPETSARDDDSSADDTAHRAAAHPTDDDCGNGDVGGDDGLDDNNAGNAGNAETEDDTTLLRIRRFDLAGFVLSAVGFGTLVFGIIEGPKIGFFTQIRPFSIGPLDWPATLPSAAGIALVIAAVSLTAFVFVEKSRSRADAPVLLELGMFRYPTFSWGNATALMVAIGEFALVFVLPLYLISAVGLSTVVTGVILAGMALGAFLSGAMARHLAARIGAPGVVLLGLGLEVFGALQLAAEERSEQPLWLVVVALTIYGLGLGLASAQLTSLVLGDIPESLSGQASATQSTIRQVGSALGAALAGAMLTVGIRTNAGDLPSSVAHFAEPLSDSAGGLLNALRAQGAPADIIAPLSKLFADATRLSLFSAVAALTIGFICALMVRRSHAESDAEAPTDAPVN
ncbi:MFS transporter [Corynebacterium freneyi]|uniref:MFS transporter n=1 Tax=Corynebacterium freneyi TaxID=134034 RepID=UPI001CCFEE41|nr:MFS transporter [Corynebacterium freneyi]UBI01680.1 MFS transporter [Corynebacterium freneyi]